MDEELEERYGKPMVLSAKECNINALQELFELWTKSGRNEDKETLLHISASVGNVSTFNSIFFLELEKQDNKPRSDGWLALHCAAYFGHPKICQIILPHVPDENPKANNGSTPLHLAAQKGHFEVYELIMNKVYDKNPKMHLGLTPLHLAAREGFGDICRLILPHVGQRHPRTDRGETPLHFAAQRGNIEIYNFMMTQMNDKNPKKNDGWTPLHDFALQGRVDLCKMIVSQIEDKNPKTDQGLTPLHLAAQNGHHQVYLTIMKLVISRNPAMHYQNTCMNIGFTPLHLAAKSGHASVCEVILQNIGHNKNPRAAHGITPLHLAAQHGHQNIYRMIMPHVADKNPKLPNGWTPLHDFVKQNLIDICMHILPQIEDKNPRSEKGWTPLHVSAQHGHNDLFIQLYKYVSDKNPQNSDGLTPLHLSAQNGNDELCKFILTVVRNKSPKTLSGDTPIHFAARCGRLGVCKILWKEIDFKWPQNKSGKTPFHEAAKEHQLEVVSFFMNQYLKLVYLSYSTQGQLKNIIEDLKVLNNYYSHFSSMRRIRTTEDVIDKILKFFLTPLRSLENRKKLSVLLRFAMQGYLAVLQLVLDNSLDSYLSELNLYQLILNGMACLPPNDIEHVQARKLLESLYKSSNHPCNRQGWTILHEASKQGNISVVKLILSICEESNPSDRFGLTPLDVAVQNRHQDIVDYLIQKTYQRDSIEEMPFLIAEKGLLEVYKFLVKGKANINPENEQKVTPLHIASQFGNLAIVQFIGRQAKETEPVDKDGRKPIHYASIGGNTEVLQFILEEMTMSYDTKTLNSPLILATQNRNLSACKLLLSHGANPMLEDEDGKSAHKIAMANKADTYDIWEIFTEAKKSKQELKRFNKLEKLCLTNDHISLQKQFGHLVNNASIMTPLMECGPGKNNPFMIAAKYGSNEVLQTLIQWLDNEGDQEGATAILHQFNDQGECPLLLVMRNANHGVKRKLIELELKLYSHNLDKFQEYISSIGLCDETCEAIEIAEKVLILINGPDTSCFSKIKLFITILGVSLLSMSTALSDIASDILFMIGYEVDLGTFTFFKHVIQGKDTDGVHFFTETTLWWTMLFPMLLAFVFNIKELVSYTQSLEFSACGELCLVIFSPFWLIQSAVLKGLLQFKQSQQMSIEEGDLKKLKQHELLAQKARMIECCCEASLQPIIQLYLFFANFGTTASPTRSCLNAWIITQFASFILSLLSVSKTFVSAFSLRMSLSTSTKAVIALQVLFATASRHLSIQFFAFSLGQHWYRWVYPLMTGHILLMTVVGWLCTSSQGFMECCFSGFTKIITYHPYNEETKKPNFFHHFIVESIIFLETAGITIYCIFHWDTFNALFKLDFWKVIVSIWGCYGMSLLLTIVFYFSLHPLSEFNKSCLKGWFCHHKSMKSSKEDQDQVTLTECIELDGVESLN